MAKKAVSKKAKKYNKLELLLEEVERKMRPLGNPVDQSSQHVSFGQPTRGVPCNECCSCSS